MIPIAAASTLALIALTPGPGLLLGFTELVVTVLAGTPEFIESRHELLLAGDLRHGERGFLGPRQRRLEGGMIGPDLRQGTRLDALGRAAALGEQRLGRPELVVNDLAI